MGLFDELKKLTRPYEEDEYDDEEEEEEEDYEYDDDDEPSRRNLRRVTPRTPSREPSRPSSYGGDSRESASSRPLYGEGRESASPRPLYGEGRESTSPRPLYGEGRDSSSRSTYGDSYDYGDSTRRTASDKVVNIHTTTQLQVVLVKPEKFENASNIADHLRDKRTVVLNLESTNKDVARRLVDFLSGVAYAQEGKIKKISAATYIITPYNVDIIGDLIDELENSGLYF